MIPTIIGTTRKDRSGLSAFQALRAAITPGCLTLASPLVGSRFIGIYLISIVPFLQNANIPHWVVSLRLSISSSVPLPWGLAWLVIDLHAILAAVLIFRGSDFRDRILGSLVEGFLQK